MANIENEKWKAKKSDNMMDKMCLALGVLIEYAMSSLNGKKMIEEK